MSDLRSRISGVVLNRLADYGIDMIAREIADSVAETVLSLPGIAITQVPERTTNSNGYDWKADGDTVFCDIFDGRKVSAVVLESDSGEAQLIYPQNPHALAAALLAAAVQAQEEK